MSLKKNIFKFSPLYNLIPIHFLLKLSGKKDIAVFYHYVGKKNNELTQNLYTTKNKIQFIDDIRYLKKHFISLSIDDFVNKKSNKKYGFFLSFDDGLANFYNVVAPILLQEKVKAINFLNSDFIDNKGLFYRYKVNILIDFLLNNQLTENQKKEFCNQLDLSRFTLENAVHHLKKVDSTTTHKVDVLLGLIGFDIDNYLKQNQPYLTKNQIKDLIDKGFHFGAHSKNHPRYIKIPLNQQIEQTLQSVHEVSKTFQLDVNYFSFPFSDDGVTNTFFEKINNKVTATFGSSGLKDERITSHYQRIQMEYDSIYSAETILKGELLYYLLKRILKKHITKRT